VGVSRVARGNQDWNPRKSADPLIRNGHTWRLGIQIVDGCDNLLGTIVADLDRDRVADRSGGSQKHRHNGGNYYRFSHFTHSTPLTSPPTMRRLGCQFHDASSARRFASA
jgi:hypothetical protein